MSSPIGSNARPALGVAAYAQPAVGVAAYARPAVGVAAYVQPAVGVSAFGKPPAGGFPPHDGGPGRTAPAAVGPAHVTVVG